MGHVLVEELDFTSSDLKEYNRNGVLEYLSQYMYQKGVVKPSFFEAIISRERAFPTGLDLPKGGVAIPHTDPEHVIHDDIVVMRLKNPVEFNHMVLPNKTVETRIIIMIAVKKQEKQTHVLSSLMELIQNEANMQTMLNEDKEDILGLLKEYKLMNI